MRSILLLLFGLIPITFIVGQSISGQIKDSKSHAPIQYANIGIANKNIGTITDSVGHFQLSLTNALASDSLRISIIGYVSKTYKVGDIRKSGFPKFSFLESRIFPLQEVVVSNKDSKAFQLGLKKKYCYPIPFYKGVESKVGFPHNNFRNEMGSRFSNFKRIMLDSIQLNVAECHVEKLNLRLNVYSIKEDSIIKNILKQPIYISLTKSEALNTPVINVVDQYIEIDTDFLVTIENYNELQDGALYLLANFRKKGKRYPGYYRVNGQSDWLKLKSKKSKSIGLSILAFGH